MKGNCKTVYLYIFPTNWGLIWELNCSDILLLFIIRSCNMPENNRVQSAPVLNLLPSVVDCARTYNSCQGWYLLSRSSFMCLFLKILFHTQVFLSSFWTNIKEFLEGDHDQYL